MNSHRKDSVLYDPDISLTEEQLSQEIDILTAELEKYRHVKDDRSISHVDTPRKLLRHSYSVFKKQEYLKRHTKNIHRVETIKRSNRVVEKKVGVTERGQDDFDQSDPENLIEDISDDISSIDNPDDAYSDGQDSKLKACYSEQTTDGSVNGKDEEKEAVYHCTVYSKEDTSQKKETKKVYQTPKDESSGPTVRKRCAPLLVHQQRESVCPSYEGTILRKK
ncbi:Hypothetical predicted protein [Mytilus galloprovincialis]|uniref:Uncharacterized protein n=1 Tax=Mytilus galloprovincialis TaxID=29158 RepID=A0A8B6DC92_MYTGA|nr:Hypothetical predicted protein [Mytilus galloprovincialis]